MTVEEEKTAALYLAFPSEWRCGCDACRLYYARAREIFPQLAVRLDALGADIASPWELAPIESEDGSVTYVGAQYIIFGRCEAAFSEQLGDITLRCAEPGSWPDPGLTEDYFVLEALPMTIAAPIETEETE